MFKELLPVLRDRAVLMTVTLVDADQIRVNLVPKKLKDGDNDALTTPLSVTGSAEDLDAELSSTIVGFVGSHLQMKNTWRRPRPRWMRLPRRPRPRRARSRRPRQGQYRRRQKSLRISPPPSLPSQRSLHRRSPQASSICRHQRLHPPLHRQSQKKTLDLQR